MWTFLDFFSPSQNQCPDGGDGFVSLCLKKKKKVWLGGPLYTHLPFASCLSWVQVRHVPLDHGSRNVACSVPVPSTGGHLGEYLSSRFS